MLVLAQCTTLRLHLLVVHHTMLVGNVTLALDACYLSEQHGQRNLSKH
jgi:hypothetical protein